MIIPWSHSLSQKWDAYCDENALAWFWHRSGWLEYASVRVPDLKNMSFAVINDQREIVGICPIILEGAALTIQGAPCPSPISQNDAATAEMWHHLSWLIKAYRIDTYDLCGYPVFTEGSWADISSQIRTIELHTPREIESIRRWQSVRKSYKSLIHRVQKTHRIERSIDPTDVEILHDLHRVQAGRETRSQRTWDLMAGWVASGHAYLCTAFNSAGICDGAIYVYRYKGREYYGHAATLFPDINHALLWEAIRTSDSEMLIVGAQGHPVDNKDQAIQFFKRGFGGTTLPSRASRLHC